MDFLFGDQEGRMVNKNPIVKFDNNLKFQQTKNHFENEEFKNLIANNQVFIDAGSYMLGKSDEYVASKILDILIEKGKQIRKVIYFKDGIPVIFDINKNINPLPNKSMNNQKRLLFIFLSTILCWF